MRCSDSTRYPSYTGMSSTEHMYLASWLMSMLSGRFSGNPEFRSASSTSGSNSCIRVSTLGMFLLYTYDPPDLLSSPSCNAFTLSIHASSFTAPSLLSGRAMLPTTADPFRVPSTSPPNNRRSLSPSVDGSLCVAPGSSNTRTPSPSSSPSGLGTLMNSSTSPTAGT